MSNTKATPIATAALHPSFHLAQAHFVIHSCPSMFRRILDNRTYISSRLHRMRMLGAVAIVFVLAMSAAKAQTQGGEAKVAKAAAAALADAKQEMQSSKLVLVAGNPSFWENITDTNKIAIFIDKDTIAGTTARFSVYPLDQLRATMHTDPRAWLIEPVAPIRPGYPSGPDLRTLANALATRAANHTEPSTVYTATYQCEAQTVRVSVGDKQETSPVGFWGADPRNIGIAARYFCPNYSVSGVTFYKYDK